MLSSIYENHSVDISVYKYLLDNIPYKLFLKDTNSVYMLVNNSYAQDFNVPPEYFYGKTDYDFFEDVDAEKYRKDDKIVVNTRSPLKSCEDYHHGSEKKTVRTFKYPVFDNNHNVIGVMGIFCDMTDCVNNTLQIENLKKEKDLFKRVFENSGTPMALVDSKFKIFNANKAFMSFVKYPVHKVLGIDLVDFIEQSEKDQVLDILNSLGKNDTDCGIKVMFKTNGTYTASKLLIDSLHSGDSHNYMVVQVIDYSVYDKIQNVALRFQKKLTEIKQESKKGTICTDNCTNLKKI